MLNLSGTKLNSASRINRYVTQAGSLSITSAVLQNGGLRVSFELQRKLFHVTASRQALPPVFIIILRPLSKIAAILFGRTFRKWWRALPADKKQDLILRLKRSKMVLLGELVNILALSDQFSLKTTSRYGEAFIGFTYNGNIRYLISDLYV
jgi:hypothetical protein